MNIILIPTAKLVNEELQSRYGKIVPILIPLENGIVLDRLYKEYENYYDEIIITLYEEVENTLKIINLKNYPKLKIKTLSKLDDIGNGIREVLRDLKNKENISNLSINFGDTYIKNLNKSKKSSSKEYYLIISNEKSEDKNNLNSKEMIKTDLKEKYFKIKENLARCGNLTIEINEKEDIVKIYNTFLNTRKNNNKE